MKIEIHFSQFTIHNSLFKIHFFFGSNCEWVVSN